MITKTQVHLEEYKKLLSIEIKVQKKILKEKAVLLQELKQIDQGRFGTKTKKEVESDLQRVNKRLEAIYKSRMFYENQIGILNKELKKYKERFLNNFPNIKIFFMRYFHISEEQWTKVENSIPENKKELIQKNREEGDKSMPSMLDIVSVSLIKNKYIDQKELKKVKKDIKNFEF